MRALTLIVAVGLLGLAPPAARAQTYGDPYSLVDYWYRTYLRRAPDPGIAVWVDRLNRGTPPDQVLAGILGSPEYYGLAGSNPAGFITRLYADLFRRSPSSGELSYWMGRMYVENRDAVADEILIQNPGFWVGSGPPAAPPTIPVAPGSLSGRYGTWDRDRRPDWYRHHDIYDYRRP